MTSSRFTTNLRVSLWKCALAVAPQNARRHTIVPLLVDGVVCVEGMDDECHRRRLAGTTAIEKCSMNLPVVKTGPVAKRRQQQ
jgi:hypothetical protein